MTHVLWGDYSDVAAVLAANYGRSQLHREPQPMAKAQKASQEPQYFRGRDAEDYVLATWCAVPLADHCVSPERIPCSRCACNRWCTSSTLLGNFRLLGTGHHRCRILAIAEGRVAVNSGFARLHMR